MPKDVVDEMCEQLKKAGFVVDKTPLGSGITLEKDGERVSLRVNRVEGGKTEVLRIRCTEKTLFKFKKLASNFWEYEDALLAMVDLAERFPTELKRRFI